MALSIIGIGLKDEKSITVEGLEAVKDADAVYLEVYTSVLADAGISGLEKFYGKKIIRAGREMVEKDAEKTILKDAKEKKVCFLVAGDPFSATTHIDLYRRAVEGGIKVSVINNASIINAVGIVGLELYKYGKITSIPFCSKNISAPFDVYKMNKKNGLHTLFLLDLDPENKRFMSCKDAVDYLLSRGLDKSETIISCARIGGARPVIKKSSAENVEEINEFPQCLIIPGKLHFFEEEVLNDYA